MSLPHGSVCLESACPSSFENASWLKKNNLWILSFYDMYTYLFVNINETTGVLSSNGGSCPVLPCLATVNRRAWRNPASTRRWANVGLMLAQRRRRCANIKTTLTQRLVFAWNPVFCKATGLFCGGSSRRWPISHLIWPSPSSLLVKPVLAGATRGSQRPIALYPRPTMTSTSNKYHKQVCFFLNYSPSWYSTFILYVGLLLVQRRRH